MAPPKQNSTHQMSAYYSIYRPRKDERLSWPSWSTYSGRFIHISGHPSAAGHAQGRKVRRRITYVLPLCYATKCYSLLTACYHLWPTVIHYFTIPRRTESIEALQRGFHSLSLIHWFHYPCNHYYIHSLIHSLTHSFIPPFLCLFIHSLTHLHTTFIHSSIHSHIQSFTPIHRSFNW